MVKRGLLAFLVLFVLSCNEYREDSHSTAITESVYGVPELHYSYHSPNEGLAKVPGLIVLGGSEGGLASAANWANDLSHRYNVAALGVAYFGYKNLPPNLELIQLEYVAQAIDFLRSKPEVDTSKIGIIGVSKGGELALLIASNYPKIKFVVGYVPSNVAFQGLKADWSFSAYSSWEYREERVSFLPYAAPHEVKGNEIADMYRASLTHLDKYPDAIIPVENINGPILLFSGEDDNMWPATDMCNMIIDQLDSLKFAHSYEHISFKDAGHWLSEPHRDVSLGGTENGNFLAGKRSQEKMGEFIKNL